MSEPKPMSKAVADAQRYRDLIHEGKQKIMAEDFSCVVYLYIDSLGKPCAIGYRGRAKKAAFHYSYSSEASRSKCVTEWMEAQANRGRRQPEARALSVGDVLRASWGYEQTNIDYYMVTRLIGKTSVELVEIGQQRDTGGDQGQCVPDKTKIISEPFRRRANGSGVRIDSVSWAYKIESTTIAGVEIFKPDHWTAYH